MHSLRASPVFALAVLTTLGIAGLIGLMVLLMQLQPGFLGMAHGTDPHHRTHDLTYGFLFGTAVVGILAQLRTPSKNVAGMVMALIPWLGLLLAAVLSTDAGVILSVERVLVAALTVITALLHPTGRDFFRTFSVSRVSWVMLALVIIAAVPLIAFASTNIGLQATVPDDHAALGHYGFMAAFSFTVIGVGLLASLRPDGWRLSAWVAGLLPALLGLTSVMYPDNSSSLGLVWAVAAIAWGVMFVAVAERTTNVGLSADDTRVEADREPTTSTPRWVNVFGIITLVLVLLVIINTVTGLGGGRLHAPPGGAGSDRPPGDIPPEAEPVRARFESYTVEQAAREGYVRDEFCLDAAAFGQPAERGAMGFHATNETLLRGPIDSNRPQALLFDAQGRVLGVEYEVVTDAVSEPPRLFGQTFVKLPAHPGVEHEHYALHLWFIENPNGALADFNPSVSCPPGSTPRHGPGGGGH